MSIAFDAARPANQLDGIALRAGLYFCHVASNTYFMLNPAYEDVLAEPERWLTDLQRRWLRPRGAMAWMANTLLYWVNWWSVRLLFRFAVEGRQYLPASGSFILAPNHSSPLDPQFLAAGLPLPLLRRAYWAGKESTVLKTWLRRLSSWYTRIVPIASDATALAPAVKILEQGNTLIWFPEGSRSLDGELHEFKPGLAWLLTRCDVPVVPVFIEGAHAAFPGRRTMPRLRSRVVVRIGPPQTAVELGLKHDSAQEIERAADSLRRAVIRLRDQSSSKDDERD